jgi:hypothetical protein
LALADWSWETASALATGAGAAEWEAQMADVPAACQDLADAVAQDHAHVAALVAAAEAEIGQPAWATLEQLAIVRRDLLVKKKQLDVCVLANTAAMSGTLDVLETRSNPPVETDTVLLWDAAEPGNAPVSGVFHADAFGFPAPIPDRRALTVTALVAGAPAGTGFDFRSGELPQDLVAPHIELLLFPDITVGLSQLQSWADALLVDQQTGLTSVGGLPLGVEIAVDGGQVALDTGQGQIQLTVHATVNVVSDVLPVPANPVPVDITIPMVLFPDQNPLGVPAQPLRASVVASQITLHDNGLLFNVPDAAKTMMYGLIREPLETQLGAWLNPIVPDLVTATFSIGELPPGSIVTVRSVTVGTDAISATAVLGVLGDALSTYTPKDIIQ